MLEGMMGSATDCPERRATPQLLRQHVAEKALSVTQRLPTTSTVLPAAALESGGLVVGGSCLPYGAKHDELWGRRRDLAPA
jgi:hypothetical protein